MSTILGMTDRHQAQAYPLRLPADLKAKVEEAAAASGRSLNAEIIARLESTFLSPEESMSVAEMREILKSLQRDVKAIKKGMGAT